MIVSYDCVSYMGAVIWYTTGVFLNIKHGTHSLPTTDYIDNYKAQQSFE